MKNISNIYLLMGSVLYADCSKVPDGASVMNATKAKQYDKAKVLLATLKVEVQTYLDTCDKSQKISEQTSLVLLTCESHLSDLADDMTKATSSVDCSVVPNSTKLEEAFEAKDNVNIESLYIAYQKGAENYISHCASDAAYETVYESSMLCDEMYDEWKKAK